MNYANTRRKPPHIDYNLRKRARVELFGALFSEQRSFLIDPGALLDRYEPIVTNFDQAITFHEVQARVLALKQALSEGIVVDELLADRVDRLARHILYGKQES